MSKLIHLTLSQFRCFSQLEIPCDQVCNVIIGANGRGKSSILEAIYFLATARSFRSAQVDALIRHEEAGCAVNVILAENRGLRTKKLRGQKPEVFHQQTAINTIKELADLLPVSIIHRSSYIQFAKATEERRRVLDWLLFHVEHSYHPSLRAYNQTLQHRNALLKKCAQPREIKVWSERLAELGEALHTQRAHHCERWFSVFQQLLQQYFPEIRLNLAYMRGWAQETSLLAALTSNLSNEMRRGFTLNGPHRADLRLTINGESWERVLSTGQAKTALFCLFFSQYLTVKTVLGVSPVVLLDDLFGDLDVAHVKRLLSMASSSDAQFFISSIGHQHEIESILEAFPAARMFHVEHADAAEPTDTC